MTKVYDVIVIGGGAAGMIAAGRAGELGKRVLLFEKNAKLGQKLAISGGGRCNILNAEEDVHALLSQYGKAEQVLRSPFSQFGMRETRDFFESRGLPLIVEARKRAFPRTGKAADVVQVLREYMKRGNVEVLLRTPVSKIRAEGERIAGVIAGGKEYAARSYIVATGGVSHPETGSTGEGFGWLASLGHTIAKPTPTIVPLRTSEAWSHGIAGTACKDAKITFFLEGKRCYSVRGPLLFTHFGLSGPTILNTAGKIADLLQSGTVTAVVDTYPDLDLGILERKIIELFDAHKNKLLKNVFKDIAPPGAHAAILSLAKGVDPEKKIHSITKEERRTLSQILKGLPVTITGLMGFERAVVADGGVSMSEIDSRTLRSATYTNLYIIGDLLHIRRPSGGYSLQLAWTTGYVAGSSA